MKILVLHCYEYIITTIINMYINTLKYLFQKKFQNLIILKVKNFLTILLLD